MTLAGHLRFGWTAFLALCLYAASLPLVQSQGHAQSYDRAKSAFAQFEVETRVEIELLLMATGDYNGLLEEELSRRGFSAIQKFETRNGIYTDGIISSSELETLRREGWAFTESLGLAKRQFARNQAELFVPQRLFTSETPTARGFGFRHVNDSVSLDITSIPLTEANFRDVFDKLSAENSRRTISYKLLKPGFFVVSGKFDGKSFYSRFHVNSVGTTGFTFSWSEGVFPAGQRTSVLLSNLFFTEISEHPNTGAIPLPDADSGPNEAEPKISTGSGFFVSSDGVGITNQHVIEDCDTIVLPGYGQALIIKTDPSNDLAMIELRNKKRTSFAIVRKEPATLGEPVFAIGFPLAGALDNGLNITNGIVSSLAGIGNDSRQIQFTAAVQHGNSGGPLLDETGAVIGIVHAKFDDSILYENTGSVPQNLSYAVRSEILRVFLSTAGKLMTKDSERPKKSPSEIAAAATKYAFQVICLPEDSRVQVAQP